MFKPAFIALLLSTCFSVAAQTSVSMGQAKVMVSMASAYQTLADTIKVQAYLSQGSDVQIVGQPQDPRWVLVARGNKQYYLRRQDLGLRAIEEEAPIISPAMVQAIPRDAGTGAVHYTGIETVDGQSKNDLFVRAKTWVINSYNSPRTVTKTEDKETGIIVCKAYTEVPVSFLGTVYNQRLYYTAKISIKEGRFKYDLTDFYFQAFPSAQRPYPQQEPVETYLNYAYNAAGKPNRNALEYTRALIERASMLEASIKKALIKGDEW